MVEMPFDAFIISCWQGIHAEQITAEYLSESTSKQWNLSWWAQIKMLTENGLYCIWMHGKIYHCSHIYRMFQKELYNGIPNVFVWRVLQKRLHLVSVAYPLWP
jgi:hypothetical protein